MRKLYYLMTMLFLFLGIANASADSSKHKLSLGNYDDIVAGDPDDTQCYNASYYMTSPTQLYCSMTGNQIIYTKEQLTSMAGKEITGISFAIFNQSCYSTISRTVKIWLQEVDDDTFNYNSEKKKYSFFEFANATEAHSKSYEFDYLESAGWANAEMSFDFDTPFAYSGEKNLVVTISFDGTDCTDGATDILYYYNTEDAAKKKVMAYASDKASFATYHDSEDWPVAISGCGTPSDQISQPLTQFTYQESSKPVVKPAQLSGTVKCGETPVEGATVELKGKADTVAYSTLTGTDGKYSISIDNITEKYALSVKATDFIEYVTTDSLTFTSDEKRTLDIELTKADKPSVLSGKILSTSNNTPVKDATITLKNVAHEYKAQSDEKGEYTINILKSEEKYKLSVAAPDFEDYTSVDSISFVPGEPKKLNITLKKIDKPSILSGMVSCKGAAIKGAKISLKSKNSTYTYNTTTDEEGKYAINVIKSEVKYKLTATEADYEDYTEADSIVFVPGENMTKDIEMTLIANPDSTVTLGKYNRFLKEGDASNCYYGHGYSWAASPTHFYLKHSGSQIIYTKEQLAQMSGMAIKQINFIYYNESCYESYPRTVKVTLQEIEDDAFEYNTQTGKYKFFEYTDATIAISKYEFAGDLYENAGSSAELSLVFDKPINYSGEKNLLVTVTFDGENTCNSLDMNFFCQEDVKNKAMSYMSDSYTFDTFAETEDWPFTTDDCISNLEQPVTRFYYTKAVATGISSISTKGNSSPTSAKRYNLAGQSVSSSYKGIVICNGKKYVK